MVEFLKIQYRLGAIDETYLDKLVLNKRITEKDKELIVSQK